MRTPGRDRDFNVPYVADGGVGQRESAPESILPWRERTSLVERFPDLFGPAYISIIHWAPDLLAEAVRRRVYVATEGASAVWMLYWLSATSLVGKGL